MWILTCICHYIVWITHETVDYFLPHNILGAIGYFPPNVFITKYVLVRATNGHCLNIFIVSLWHLNLSDIMKHILKETTSEDIKYVLQCKMSLYITIIHNRL